MTAPSGSRGKRKMSTKAWVVLFVVAVIIVTGIGAVTDKSNGNKPTAEPTQPSKLNPSDFPTSEEIAPTKPQPTLMPTLVPTEIPPQSKCAITATQNPEKLLAADLTYGVNFTGLNINKTVAAMKWDFNGDGFWDSGFVAPNRLTHIFPKNGDYKISLQLKMSDGEITPTCSSTFTIPFGFQVKLTGQVFSDDNCNTFQDSGEKGIPGVTVNIPGASKSGMDQQVVTDRYGTFELIGNPGAGESITLSPQSVASMGYTTKFRVDPVTLTKTQPNGKVNIPEVPYDKLSQCLN